MRQLVKDKNSDLHPLRDGLRVKQTESAVRPAGSPLGDLRSLKLHRPGAFGGPKPVPYSPSCGLNFWSVYERNIRADYEMVFGAPPGASIGIGIMTDSDNTCSHAQAWSGPIVLN